MMLGLSLLMAAVSVGGQETCPASLANIQLYIAPLGLEREDVWNTQMRSGAGGHTLPIPIHSTKVSIKAFVSPPAAIPEEAALELCIDHSILDERGDTQTTYKCGIVSNKVESVNGPFLLNLKYESHGEYRFRMKIKFARSDCTMSAEGGGADAFVFYPGPMEYDTCDESYYDGHGARFSDGYVSYDGSPATRIPRDKCLDYTLGGVVPVVAWYYDDATFLKEAGSSYAPRSREEIEALMEKARGLGTWYYGMTDTWLYQSLDEFPIRGKSVLMIGSNNPWYESICIVREGGSCTTLEYNKLSYSHEKITTVTVADFEREWVASPSPYDVIWSISSLEHDGLGRYGDPLNPWGDLQAMRKIRGYLKDDGIMVLSVPVGLDAVVWNMGRVYGKLRLPLLLHGWKVLATFGFHDSDFTVPCDSRAQHQPIFVLQKEAYTSV